MDFHETTVPTIGQLGQIISHYCPHIIPFSDNIAYTGLREKWAAFCVILCARAVQPNHEMRVTKSAIHGHIDLIILTKPEISCPLGRQRGARNTSYFDKEAYPPLSIDIT